jgi:hypothetical protein
VNGIVSRTTDASGLRTSAAEFNVDWRPLPQARMQIGPSYESQRTTGQYVQAVSDPSSSSATATRYVFANVRQRELRLDTRLDLTFSPWLSLQLFLQPFASSGEFSRLKEFRTPRRFDFAEYGVDRGTIVRLPGGDQQIDPDGSGPATPFRVANQDFTVRALRGNAVLRWEYKPGSALFLVWSQQREEQIDAVQPNIVGQAARSFSDAGQHVLLVKYTKWIGR